MSFLIGNCCLKLNYLICGSKDFSTKKKKFNLRQQTIINDVSSNNKIINQTNSSPITSYHQYYFNDTSLQPQNSPVRRLQCNKNNRTIKTSCYSSSSLNCSIDQSDLILNNQIIIKNVILHRNNPNERLGLTLSYGLTSRSMTNIYIEQVDKESIADRQGELQRGDQIIKINNHRVTNREQAIQLVKQNSIIILQILRFQIIKTNLSITLSEEDDSGVILGFNTDFETNNQLLQKKSSNSLSCLSSNHCSICRENRLYSEQIAYRRCLSLNNLTNYSFIQQEINRSKSFLKEFIYSQSLFETTTDNEKAILKPLPFNHPSQQIIESEDNNLIQINRSPVNQNSKSNRRRYREQRLKELITTDDEVMSEMKQGRYWTREQRKQQFQRSKQRKKFIRQDFNNSTTEDFNLLNRIFLRENKKELKEKPYLAVKYQQQSTIEREKLNKIIQKYPIHHRSSSQATTNKSINTSLSTIII